jgi:hypothetical protein
MPRPLFETDHPRRVANCDLRTRIIEGITILGEIEGTEAAAVIGFGWPRAVKRRRLIPVLRPSDAQRSAARRALAKLKAAGIIVGAGRRRRVKVYRLAFVAESFESLRLGDFDK